MTSAETVIETDRLILRPLRASDAAELARQLNNLDIAKWTSTVPFPYTLQDAEDFIALATQDGEGFCRCAITRKEQDRLIGVCAIESGKAAAPELGYWVAQPEWGQGIASEAARAVVRHGFTAMGLELLAARHWHGNERSRRILEGCGFRHRRDEIRFSKALGCEVMAALLDLPRQRWQGLANETQGR